MTKVLFVPTNSRELAQFSSVKAELERMNVEISTISPNDKVSALLKQGNYTFKRLDDYRTFNLVNVIDREKADLVQASFAGVTPDVYALVIAAVYRDIPCLQIYDGVLVYEDIIGVPRAKNEKHLSLWRLLLISFRKIASTFRRKRNILAMLYLLFTLRATSSSLQFMKKLPKEILRFTFPVGKSHRYVKGTSMAVPNQALKDAFTQAGYPPESVFVTGQPRLDRLINRKFSKDRLRSDLGIARDKEIAVLATQPLKIFLSDGDRKKLTSAVVNAMDSFPEEQLVIKLHPEEHISEYKQVLREINRDNVILCQTIDVYELLNASNLVMTIASTVALEAMLFNKPVLCIDFTGRVPIHLFTEDGAAIAVHQEADLVPAIHKALHDPQTIKELEQGRKKFIDKHIYKPDGLTSKRVAELIVRLIAENKEPGQKKGPLNTLK